MKQTHIEIRKEKHEVTDFIECDLCHRRNDGYTWGTMSYDAREIKVSAKIGESYPECGRGDLTEFDICPECFETKLIPWLASQGAMPRKTEWEY